jgi:hypothetical protein
MKTMVNAQLFTQNTSLNAPLEYDIQAQKLFSFNSDYS